MSCEITILSVNGEGTAGSTAASIEIAGTARDCASISVTLRCLGGSAIMGTALVLPSGNWTIKLTNTACRCGDMVEVEARCVADPLCSTTDRRVLTCTEVVEPRCPDISTPTVIYGDCLPDGNRHVTLDATVTPSGPGTVSAQWEYAPGLFSRSASGTGVPFSVHGDHIYSPGMHTHTVFLRIDPPMDRCDVPVDINVPPCPPAGCPHIESVTAEVSSTCNADGTRTVRLTARLSGSPASNYLWDFGDRRGTTIDATMFPPDTTHDFAAPGTEPTTYNATLVAANTNPTCSVPYPFPIVVPGCGAPCPAISGELTVTPGACTDATHRRMTLDAMISGSGVTDFEWNFGDGTASEHPSGGPRIDHVYTAPGSYTARLTLRGPTGCPDSTRDLAFSVEACPAATTTTTMTMTPPASSCLCSILIFLALMFELAAVILGIVAVATSNPYVGLFGLAALITALILLIIWMAACRDCRTLRAVIGVVAGFTLLAVTAALILVALHGPFAIDTLAMTLAVVTLAAFLGVAEIGRQLLGCP